MSERKHRRRNSTGSSGISEISWESGSVEGSSQSPRSYCEVRGFPEGSFRPSSDDCGRSHPSSDDCGRSHPRPSSDDCGREVPFPFRPSLDDECDKLLQILEEASYRAVKKIRRTERVHTRMAIDEILSAKDDALSEIEEEKRVFFGAAPGEGEFEKLREEVNSLSGMIDNLAKIVFRAQ